MAGTELPDHLKDLLSSERMEKETGSKPCSSNGDNDESSIEALNWSDLEDELNEDDSKLLRSINSQFSENSDICEFGLGHGVAEICQTQTDSVSTLMNDSKSQEEQKDFINANNDDKYSEMIKSSLSVLSDVNSLDSASNAPVLDDGPIWAKGSKLYKFEENRRFNQKLTVCLLFSLVLAIGLGVGNLAAYNECEAEHKAASLDEKLSQPVHTASEDRHEKITRSGIGNNGNMEILEEPSSNSMQSERVDVKVEDIPEADGTKSNIPMIDPKYALHAEELSRVLKMLDELARKIDRFENTTRQLGGIVMLRDEIIRPDTKTKKSKFLGLLDEIMKNKGKKQKKVTKEDPQQQESWRVKKEQVLDEIAEAVLSAMEVNIEGKESLPEPEVKFQMDYKHTTSINNENKDNHENIKNVESPQSKTKMEEKDEKNKISGNRNKRNSGGTKRSGRENQPGKWKSPDIDNNSKGKSKKLYNQKEKQDDFKRKEKNKPEQKNKLESEDWQIERAKFRQEGRVKRIIADNDNLKKNKKGKNWQIQRDNVREKLRKEKFS